MFNKIYLIAYLLCIVYHVFGIQTLKMSEVLSIKVEKDSNSQCPSYSMGSYDVNVCSYRFFCRDETCYPVTNNSTNTVEFADSKGKVENYNIDHWMENYETTKIPCVQNSDCFSDKCDNGFCTLNDKADLKQCMDTYNYQYKNDFINLKYKVKINCGKAAHVKCTFDHECASNNCLNSECNNDNYKPVSESHALIYSIIVLVIVAILIAVITYFSCRLCKSKKSKNPKLQPMKNLA